MANRQDRLAWSAILWILIHHARLHHMKEQFLIAPLFPIECLLAGNVSGLELTYSSMESDSVIFHARTDRMDIRCNCSWHRGIVSFLNEAKSLHLSYATIELPKQFSNL